MRWVRVNIKDMRLLSLPDICPNCLSTPADVVMNVSRCAGVPFFASVRTSVDWPFCARCAAWFKLHARRQLMYGVAPAALLLAAAIGIALLTFDRGIHPAAFLLLLAALVIGVVGSVIPLTVQRFSPIPDGCLSRFPTVKPIRGGKVMLSSRSFAKLDFAHPVYVAHLLASNSPDNVTTDEQRLEKLLAAYKGHLGVSDETT